MHSKKVLDNDGKKYTLFLAPKPIKCKPLDKGKMFGSQLQYLFKQVKTSSKCGKHMDTNKKKNDCNAAQFERFLQDFWNSRASRGVD